ncbi:MAG: trimeric intracellular cation channel family protein [Akkermansia sp.]
MILLASIFHSSLANVTTVNEALASQNHWLFTFCAYAGTIIAAVGGAMASSRVRMDLFGLICCGSVCALGGGTLRDILLGSLDNVDGSLVRVFWVLPGNEIYLYMSVISGFVVFYLTKFWEPPHGTLRVLDAFAMAFFTLFGASKAYLMDCNWLVTLAMGICTGVAGGALRDLITGNVPYVFRPGELYATAAFVGAACYLLMLQVGCSAVFSYAAAVVICFGVRMAAVYLNWQLPSYRPIFETVKVSEEEEERHDKKFE